MKKTIAFIAALTLTASAVSGCGKKSDSSSESVTETSTAVETTTEAVTMPTVKMIVDIDPFEQLDFKFYHNAEEEVKENSVMYSFDVPETIFIDGEEKRVQFILESQVRGIKRCKDYGVDIKIYRELLDKDLKEGDKVTYYVCDGDNMPFSENRLRSLEEDKGIRLTSLKKELTVSFFEDHLDNGLNKKEMKEYEPFVSEKGFNHVTFTKDKNHFKWKAELSDYTFSQELKKKQIEFEYIPTLVEGRDVNNLLADDKVSFTFVLKKDGKEYRGEEANKLLEKNGIAYKIVSFERTYEVPNFDTDKAYSANVNANFQRSDNWSEIVSEKNKYTKYDISRIDGSTATIPITAELLRQFCGIDDHIISRYIFHNTTGPAYEHLILGQYDKNIIFVTEPSEEELALAAENNVELEVTPIALDGFVFITHKDNPVDSLTVEQIQGIYSGEITNWSEVGGNDEPITAYQREPNSGSQTVMENMVMAGKTLAEPPKDQIVEAMGSLIEFVAQYKNSSTSIGYTFYYYINNLYKNEDIKVLKIDGVSPDNENLLDKSYPFSSGYYAVTIKDKDPQAEEIKDYLISDEGQELVKMAGYCPIR